MAEDDHAVVAYHFQMKRSRSSSPAAGRRRRARRPRAGPPRRPPRPAGLSMAHLGPRPVADPAGRPVGDRAPAGRDRRARRGPGPRAGTLPPPEVFARRSSYLEVRPGPAPRVPLDQPERPVTIKPDDRGPSKADCPSAVDKMITAGRRASEPGASGRGQPRRSAQPAAQVFDRPRVRHLLAILPAAIPTTTIRTPAAVPLLGDATSRHSSTYPDRASSPSHRTFGQPLRPTRP